VLLEKSVGGGETALLAEDREGGDHLRACPGTGLELVFFVRANERFLPAAQLEQGRDQAEPGGGEAVAITALSRLRFDLLHKRDGVDVLLGLLDQDSQVVGRPRPDDRQLCCSCAAERGLEQDARLTP